MSKDSYKRINNLKNQLFSNNTNWITKTFDSYEIKPKLNSLKNKTLFITGASRGIGLAIAIEAAKEGANIAVVAKTVTEQKNLSGTIFTAVDEIIKAGGDAIAIECDIRHESSVKSAVEKCIEKFGSIDILINNASAISLTSIEETTMSKYDLLHSVNARGTYLCTKYCLPYLKKSENAHILTLSPPVTSLSAKWIKDFPGYALSKFGMSIYAMGFAEEFKTVNIASNTLWPRTAIATAAVKNVIGETLIRTSRIPKIMGDAAIIILKSDSSKITGNFFIDDEVLISNGTKDLSIYNVDKSLKTEDLTPDFFI